MGNIFCCGDPFHSSKREPEPQNEREALLNPANTNPCNTYVDKQPTSPGKSDFSKDSTDLQNNTDNTDVCNNDAVPTKSFPPQSSTASEAGFESKELDTSTQQLKCDHQEQVCAVQKTDVASKLKAPSGFERNENLQDYYSNSVTRESVNFSLKASSDLEIAKAEKFHTLSSAQQVESESNLQKLTGKVQESNVTRELRPAPDINGIASVDDQRVVSNTWESLSCNTPEKPEQEEKCVHIEDVQKTVQTDASNKVVDAVSQERMSDLLTESGGEMNSSDIENSMNTAKRARLSQGSDWSFSGHEGEHGQTEVVLHEDEEGAKKIQNKQSDCGMEEMENCQPSEESIHTSVQVNEWVSEQPESPELKENLSNNEKNICEAGVAEETAENLKNCNQDCFDGEEDLYRDEEEIEKEKIQRLPSESQLAEHSTVEPGVAILEYCTREWKGNTEKARLMKKAYEAVCQTFSSVRRVRGDNYCALRATLFQALSNVELLPCLQQDDLVQLPEKLIAANYIWIKQWYFGVQDAGNEDPVKKLTGYLAVLKQKWSQIGEMDSLEKRQAACEEVFKNDQEEYRFYEAMKILMLAKAIALDSDKVQEKEVPLFCWLLFARDTSTDPYQFMKNHLNHVGYTGGLDQILPQIRRPKLHTIFQVWASPRPCIIAARHPCFCTRILSL
ncbi:nestin-like isoform X2 [Heterodontus francisci]|uniref:nestin-like isoform X2 n=1 Tax=Heterodontus francisci TaxID=7792 RepID=UPI00355C3132